MIHPISFYRTARNLFRKREWRWKITASNGKTVAASSEGFVNKKDCVNNALSTMASLREYFKTSE